MYFNREEYYNMGYEINMDFYKDWIGFLRKSLIEVGYSPSKNQEDVSIQYFNLLRRMIPVRPRKVHIAKEFTCPPELQLVLDLIIEKVKQGVDLGPYLSKRIVDLDYDDDLLNDWDIYHLHLGTNLDSNGFVNRTGPVLFARFDEQNAYLINVWSHGNWTNQDMIRIIHNNWPESIEDYRLKEVTRLNQSVTDRDIQIARKAHSMLLIELEPGIVYAPPGMGLTSAGTGIEVVRVSDYYADLMRTYEDVIRDNIAELIEMVKAEGGNPGDKLSFVLKIEVRKIFVYEMNYGFTIELGELE